MTDEPTSKVYFVKLATGEDLFARLPEAILAPSTMLALEDPMIIEPIEFQGGRHLMMSRFLPFVNQPLKVKNEQVAIVQEASEIMTKYYEATLEYQTKDGGDEKFMKGVERAVNAQKEPIQTKDFNERLLCSAIAMISETKH